MLRPEESTGTGPAAGWGAGGFPPPPAALPREPEPLPEPRRWSRGQPRAAGLPAGTRDAPGGNRGARASSGQSLLVPLPCAGLPRPHVGRWAPVRRGSLRSRPGFPIPRPGSEQLPPAAARGPSGRRTRRGDSPPRGVGAGRQGEQEEDEGQAKPRGRTRRPREGSALRTPGGQGNPRRRFQAVWAEHISPGRGPNGEMTGEGGPARAPLGGTARHGPAARLPAPRC